MPIVLRLPKAAPAPLPPKALAPVLEHAKPALVMPGQHRYLDGMCRAVIDRAPNGIVSWYLMAGYLYEHHDMALITDGLFDELAQRISRDYDKLVHPQLHLIDRASAKTAGHLKYRMSTRCAVKHLIKQEWAVDIDVGGVDDFAA